MTINDPGRRKRVLDELDDEAPGQVSGKKPKFDHLEPNSAALQKTNDFNDTMYKIYITQAFDMMANQDFSGVDNLTRKVKIPLEDPESIPLGSLMVLLQVLPSHIAKLDNEHCQWLIMSVVNFQIEAITDHEPIRNEIWRAYVNFVTALVSSVPKYLGKVVHKVLQVFTAGTFAMGHDILKFIIKYNPTFISKLPEYLQKYFPHQVAEADVLVNYVGNLLAIIDYCGELQYDIWGLIIECCIKLDVELQNDLDDLDDEEIETLINGDNGEIDQNINSETDSDDEGQEIYAPISTTKDIIHTVNKLDKLLEVLLNATNAKFVELDDDATVLFGTLTSLFKSHILSTHFTKLIQFLLFSITQCHPELTESFLVMLIDVCFNPDEIIDKRLISMQYLCSFIARSPRLTKQQIIFVTNYLIDWINKYIDERELEIHDGGMERFKLFYSTFQSLLYIFCFRYQMLRDGEFWECDIDRFFQRVIITKFNPLQFIDETVGSIFAKIATKLDVCYCYSIIEQNKREKMLTNNIKIGGETTKVSTLSTVNVLNFKQKQEFLDLQNYFPFDPLVLPICKRKIEFIEWDDVNPDDDDDETSENDEISDNE